MSVAFGMAQGGGCVVFPAAARPEEHFESRVGAECGLFWWQWQLCLLESQENKVFCSAAFFPSASEEMKSFIAFFLGSIYDALAVSGFPGISYQARTCWFLNLMNVLTRGGAVSGRSHWPGTG